MAAVLLISAAAFFLIWRLLEKRADCAAQRALSTVLLAYMQRSSSSRCSCQERRACSEAPLSSKLLYLVVCLDGFLFFAFFSGVLTSWMTVAPRKAGLNSFQVL